MKRGDRVIVELAPGLLVGGEYLRCSTLLLYCHHVRVFPPNSSCSAIMYFRRDELCHPLKKAYKPS